MRPSMRKKLWILLAVLLTPVLLLALAVGVIWLLPAPPEDEENGKPAAVQVKEEAPSPAPTAQEKPTPAPTPPATVPTAPPVAEPSPVAPTPTPVPPVVLPAPPPAPSPAAPQPEPALPPAAPERLSVNVPPLPLPVPPLPAPVGVISAAPPATVVPAAQGIAPAPVPVPVVPPAAPPVQWHPFIKPGEKLSYRIGWGFVTAGYGTLEVMPPAKHDGKPAWQIVMTAKTTPFVDKIYKVRDRMESWVAPDMSRALAYNQDQKEGKTINDLDVVFDWDKSEARRTRNDEAKKPVKITPGTFDPLSALFAFRMKSFKTGDTIVIPVSDGKFFVRGTAVVLGEEKIETPAGEFDTYKIEPDIKDLAGVFKKSKGAKITVWVTKDARHIPVKVSSKVMVGSFYAELTGIEPAPAAGGDGAPKK